MKYGTILKNENFKSDYYEIVFYNPKIAAEARAGQFVHVQIDDISSRMLRRPFSIHDTDKEAGTVTVVYKVVGDGTKRLAQKKAGDCCDLLAALGNSYSDVAADEYPIIIDGGYGAAATYILAKTSPIKGSFLFGARGEQDVILTEKYQKLGWDVRIATNDGSVGKQGFVTDLIKDVIADNPGKKFKFFACGPHPMLIALSKILMQENLAGEISLDHVMCCGIGACFACVVKVNADNEQKWRYARSCSEGPVFDVKEVYLGE
jgi:dihydroorotate dehydrogenase electron transfer subunit